MNASRPAAVAINKFGSVPCPTTKPSSSKRIPFITWCVRLAFCTCSSDATGWEKMFERMIPAFSAAICGIFRECSIILLSRNEFDGVVRMPQPHTIDTVTAHDTRFQPRRLKSWRRWPRRFNFRHAIRSFLLTCWALDLARCWAFRQCRPCGLAPRCADSVLGCAAVTPDGGGRMAPYFAGTPEIKPSTQVMATPPLKQHLPAS
jgi:hypothetical protein